MESDILNLFSNTSHSLEILKNTTYKNKKYKSRIIKVFDRIYQSLNLLLRWKIFNDKSQGKEYALKLDCKFIDDTYILDTVKYMFKLIEEVVDTYHLGYFFQLFDKKDLFPNENNIIDKIESLFSIANKIDLFLIKSEQTHCTNCYDSDWISWLHEFG